MSRADLEIRRAGPGDVGDLAALWEEFTAEATFTPYPGEPFDRSLVDNHVALIARAGGRPVGSVYANLASPHFGFVFGLYARPGERRTGVGRALMREIAGIARGEGRRWLVLVVDTPNAGARAFYERLGFEDAARSLRADVEELLARLGTA